MLDSEDAWLAAGFTVLDEDEAHFLVLADVYPDALSDAEVARAINAKRHDDVGAAVWWEVAEVVRAVAACGKAP